MKTIRRLYFYAVAAISVEVVLWGVVGLLRSIVGLQRWVGSGAGDLASALALILVGIPIFAVHWLWAQKASAREDEERSAGVRAIFLYGILFGTLIPVAQNLAALLNRLFLTLAQIPVNRALVGGAQINVDNAVAIVVNLALAAYFWKVLRADWTNLTERESFIETRRLYRFLWLIYGLALTIYGVQQTVIYIFAFQTNALGSTGPELINALTPLLIGTPLWVYAWRLLQNALADADEKESYLRLGLLYLIGLGSLIVFLSSSGSALYQILARMFGKEISANELIRGLGNSLSMMIPFGALWAYYGAHLNRQFAFDENQPRRAGKRRLYVYVLSFLGLSSAIGGALTLFSALIELAFSASFLGSGISERLAGALSLLIVGLPTWLFNWNGAQTQAYSADEVGDHTRRSAIRKTYLYLVSFLAIIGVMTSAGTLLFTLINAALGGNNSPILQSTLLELTALIVFAVTLTYHLLAVRKDGSARADKLVEKQNAYRVTILSADAKFSEALKAAFAKHAPQIAPTILDVNAALPAEWQADLLILPSALAINPPQNIAAQIRSFSGAKLIVNDEAADIFWADTLARAADSAKALAEGQELRPRSSKRMNSLWIYIIYICAALFACQLIFILLAMLVSLITGGI